MNSRIKEIIASEHLSDGEFADIVGIKRSTLSHCLSGRNDVSKDIITKIHTAYPYISINWLMFGEGDSGLLSKNTIASDIFNSLQNSNTEMQQGVEYAKDFESNRPQYTHKESENQQNTPQNSVIVDMTQLAKIPVQEKKIEKIMVFYTDNTFEVFER